MPKYEKYYIVEFRYAIKVDDVSNIPQAVSRAARICEHTHGFRPENWNARIFEYGSSQRDVGHVKEYFYNPNSAAYREIMKNISYHKELIEKGIDPINIGLFDKEVEIILDDFEDPDVGD